MKSQIYTPSMTRELHIRQLNEFVWPYINKILPQFSDIESEANKVSDYYWEDVMSRPVFEDSSDDPGIYADTAIERGNDHYMMLNLGLYTVTCAWHATLFEFFHQQIRLFLYKEFRHLSDIDIKDFCGYFSEIESFFNFHNFNITKLDCWPKIDELRLLCNVIKHGEGDSAEKLREIAPHRFKDQNGIDLFGLYNTTLLHITLNIDDKSLEYYRVATETFWNEIPERCYSNEL